MQDHFHACVTSAASGLLVCLLLGDAHDRYAFPTFPLFREIREELIWADGGAVKKATDAAILSLLGPKTEADLQAGKKKPAKKVGTQSPKAAPINDQHFQQLEHSPF